MSRQKMESGHTSKGNQMKFCENNIWYKLIEEKGPDHNKRFVMEVGINDTVLGVGEGKSKKDAEQVAAKCALDKKM